MQTILNKTGTRQCNRAVWSIFADIHSTHPGALMHYLGSLEFPVICDTHEAYLIYPMLQSLKTPGLSITFGTIGL